MKRQSSKAREENRRHLYKYSIILLKEDLVAHQIVTWKRIKHLEKWFKNRAHIIKVSFCRLGLNTSEEITIKQAQWYANRRVIQIWHLAEGKRLLVLIYKGNNYNKCLATMAFKK